MRFNKFLNKFISIILIILIFPIISVSAVDPVLEKEQKRSELEKENEALVQNIKKVKEKTNKFNNIVDKLGGEINENRKQITSKKEEIICLDEQNKKSCEKIKSLEEKIISDFKRLKQRILSIYKSQDSNYLDCIFDSKNFDEFLERLILVKNVVDRDRNLFEEIQQHIKLLEQEKIFLSNEKEKLNFLIEDFEKTTGELCVLKKDSEFVVEKSSKKEKALAENFHKNEEEIKRVDGEISDYFKSQIAKKEQKKPNKKKLPFLKNIDTPPENINVQTPESVDIPENTNVSPPEKVDSPPLEYDENCPPNSNTNDSYLWPVPGFDYISCFFGKDILFGKERFHNGIDIAGCGIYQKPVVAVNDGIIAIVYDGCCHSEDWCSCGGGYGNNVVIDHEERRGFRAGTRYCHLDSICVEVGQKVKKGQVIGRVGTTGYSTGPHLHFEVWKNGEQYDPMTEYQN